MGVLAPNSVMNESKVVCGQHTTVAANDLITVPQLRSIERVVVTAEDDPVAGAQHFTAVPAGNNQFRIKGWKATAAGDTALIAATTFGRKVNYFVFGS